QPRLPPRTLLPEPRRRTALLASSGRSTMTTRCPMWAQYACALLLLITSNLALAANPLTLVQDGRAVATIVVADDALPLPVDWRLDWSTHDAATFLQDYIHRVSGATLP